MKSARAVIVDDEKLARQRIRLLLAARSDILTIAECASGSDAVNTILRLKPDLVFLDVEMPELNGLEVIDCIGPEAMPAVIFVTAYDHYAVKAFDIHAIDYLLKPFDRDRFNRAIDRALQEVGRRRMSPPVPRIEAMLSQLREDDRLTRRLLVKSRGKTTILEVQSIDWIESAGNYVNLHCGKKVHVLRETMVNIAERLDPSQFVRIHRTAIVNVDRVREIQPFFQGNAVVVLDDGHRLPLSRGYQATLEDVLRTL